MIVSASLEDFPSILDASPPSFELFFWSSEDTPQNWRSAAVSKEDDYFAYELKSGQSGDSEITFYKSKANLVERMIDDSNRFNKGGRVTVEF